MTKKHAFTTILTYIQLISKFMQYGYLIAPIIIEFGIFVCKTPEGVYYATSPYRGFAEKTKVREDIAAENEIIVFIHSHPHDNNTSILWNSGEIEEMMPGVLNMIVAPQEEKGKYSYYYHPYGRNAENNFALWNERLTYNEIWGQYLN